MDSALVPAGSPAAVKFEDGFGTRQTVIDRARNEAVDMLCLRGELTSVPSFEAVLRERVSDLASFRHGCYAQVRRVERLDDASSTLAVVSDATAGIRLSEMLEFAERDGVTLDIDAALCLLRQLVPAIAMLHEEAPDFAHGAIAAERLIVTPGARIIVVEHVLGSALDELRYSHERYWKELRIALPKVPGVPRFGPRADVTQLGVVALSLILGRRLLDDEGPSRLGELVASAWAVSVRGGLEPLPAGLRGWLKSALQLDPKHAFDSAIDAQEELERVLGESDYLAAPATLESFLTEYQAKMGPIAPIPQSAPPPVAATAARVVTPAAAAAPAASVAPAARIAPATRVTPPVPAETFARVTPPAPAETFVRATPPAPAETFVRVAPTPAAPVPSAPAAAVARVAPVPVAYVTPPAPAAFSAPPAPAPAKHVEPAAPFARTTDFSPAKAELPFTRAADVAPVTPVPFEAPKQFFSRVAEVTQRAPEATTPLFPRAADVARAAPEPSTPFFAPHVEATRSGPEPPSQFFSRVADARPAPEPPAPLFSRAADAGRPAQEAPTPYFSHAADVARPAPEQHASSFGRAAAASPAPLSPAAPVSATPVSTGWPPPHAATPPSMRKDPVTWAAPLEVEPIAVDEPAAPQSGRKTWQLAAAAVALIALAGAGVTAARRLSAPSAASSDGTLIVTTNPPGARLLVDGVEHGATPLTVTLKAGAHALELRGSGAPRQVPITITAGAQMSQYIDLPTTAPTLGQLQVRTEPAGARVTVDGVSRGTSPVTIAELSPGEHAVVLDSSFGSVKQAITVEAGVTALMMVPLGAPEGVPASGWIAVSAPAEVQIFENAKLIGTSHSDRLTVSAGRHEFEIVDEAVGYRATRTVQVAPGKVSPLRIEFPKGTIAVNAIPWAEVWVDGEKIGDTPLGNLQLTVGPHEFLFRNPDLGEQRHAVTITLAAPARLSVDLRKK